MKLSRLLLPGGLVLAFVLAGCGGSSPARPSSPSASATESATAEPTLVATPTRTLSPTRTATPSPTPEPVPPPGPAYPRGTRTGVTILDRISDAVERDDRDALAPLISGDAYPCEEQRPVQPQPLVCREGMSPGDLPRGFYVSDVEGGLWFQPPAMIADALITNLVAQDAALHSVYVCGGRCPSYGALRAPDSFVTFAVWSSLRGPGFHSFAIRGSAVVAFHFAFQPLPGEIWNAPQNPGWLLPRPK